MYQLLAIGMDEAVTWGDILIILAVIALLILIFAWAPRIRR